VKLLLTVGLALLISGASEATTLTGVNLAGGEFGGLQAIYGKDYFYPDRAQMAAFRAAGMNVFRLPVRWERVQPSLGEPLSKAEMTRIDAVVANATAMGASVIIDIHNYARYARQPIGSPSVPPAMLRDLWVRLAQRYRGNDRVIFGLMNEPVKIGATAWAAAASDALIGIRSTGAQNLVLVPGAYWSGAHSWTSNAGRLVSNGQALAGLRDPANNMAFDFHQYFDPNSSGATDRCIAPEMAEKRLAVATSWLRVTGNRGMLTEFGVGRSPECAVVLKTALEHLAANPEWIGWTIWASSAWFGSYHFNLYPAQSPPPPQLETLRPWLVGNR
jgi:endoglucanase